MTSDKKCAICGEEIPERKADRCSFCDEPIQDNKRLFYRGNDYCSMDCVSEAFKKDVKQADKERKKIAKEYEKRMAAIFGEENE